MNLTNASEHLTKAQKIVVKIGTSTLTYQTGKLNLGLIDKLARELANAANAGKKLVLVSSGAIGAGMEKLGMCQRPKTIPEKQAAAAVGQGILLHMYEKMFGEYGQTVAQVLLTRDDVAERKRYLNARNTLTTLLSLNVIPIVNENDTVAWEEIRFGENDTLSALVAALIDADLLILLSDIDGLYNKDPRTDSDAQLIPFIEEITPEVEALAGGTGTMLGSGGMASKVQAAKIAGNAGIPMVIANGADPLVIREILEGTNPGTLFVPKDHKMHHRKRWIAFGSQIQGRLVVDDGAKEALIKWGKSLLPIGIATVDGKFDAGDVVSVITMSGQEIARGIVNYTALEIDQIKGHNSRKITEILGSKDFDEVIHRNNLVMGI